MLPTHSAEKLAYPATSPVQRPGAARAARPKRSTSSATLHLDPGEEYFLSQAGIKYLLVFVVLVVLYLVLRVALAEPTDAGLMQFHFETCINVMGFKKDHNGYARAKCWADLAYQQGIERSKLNFRFFGPISKQQYMQDLKQYRDRFPEASRHSQSPFVFEGCTPEEAQYVGGADALISLLQQRYNLHAAGDCW